MSSSSSSSSDEELPKPSKWAKSLLSFYQSKCVEIIPSQVKAPAKKRKEPEKSKILFYKVRGEPYGCFSNFSPDAVIIDDLTYPTSEHYYQSKKFEGTIHEVIVRQCKKPMDAAKYARNPKLPLRSDWEQVKDSVMETALRAKFTQNSDARKTLLSTGERELVEDSPTDSYWGRGKDGKGKNMLGKLLMKIRAEWADKKQKK